MPERFELAAEASGDAVGILADEVVVRRRVRREHDGRKHLDPVGGELSMARIAAAGEPSPRALGRRRSPAAVLTPLLRRPPANRG